MQTAEIINISPASTSQSANLINDAVCEVTELVDLLNLIGQLLDEKWSDPAGMLVSVRNVLSIGSRHASRVHQTLRSAEDLLA